GPADVDAVVAVCGMAQDPFVFFVEGIHGRPGERDPRLKLARIGGQFDVLPPPSRRALLARPDSIPGRETEVVAPWGMLGAVQGAWRDIGLWEVRHRIAAGFEE